MPWSEWTLRYYENLRRDWSVPDGVEILDPFGEKEVRRLRSEFYRSYYSDSSSRQLWLGINPGRLGAGYTGIPFSDAVQLKKFCNLNAPGPDREELSAAFIFEVIEAAGGAKTFYNKVFFDSVSPLGYVKNGLNYNYYDDKVLFQHLQPRLIKHIKSLLQRPLHRKIVLLGKGKNLKYFRQLYDGDSRIIALPHPRWVMQYRRKDKAHWIERYLEVLHSEFE